MGSRRRRHGAAAAELAKDPSDGRLVAPVALARGLYDQLWRLEAEEYEARVRRLRVENELRLLVGTHDGITGIATWKSMVQLRFLHGRFKASHADLFQQYLAPVAYRPFRLL